MLVLKRRPNEAIVIRTPFGEIVTVRVLANGPEKVSLGVAAPASFAVNRAEIDAVKAARVRQAPPADSDDGYDPEPPRAA